MAFIDSKISLISSFMLILLCNACTPTVINASADSSSDAEIPEQVSASSSQVTRAKAVELNLVSVPREITLGSSVTFSPQVLYADGTQDERVLFSISDPDILSRVDNQVTPLKNGRASVFFYAVSDPNLRQVVDIVVVQDASPTTPSPMPSSSITPPSTSPSAIPTTRPSPSPTSLTSFRGVSQAELSVFEDYFLPNYAVGMQWEYTVDLVSLAVAASGGRDYPDPVILGWQLPFAGANADNITKKILESLTLNDNLATYRIEVVSVGEQSVALKTQLLSNTPGIVSQPATTRTYTPQNIGDVYTGLIQYANPDLRTAQVVSRNNTVTSFHTTPAATYLADKIEVTAPLNNGLSQEENSTFFMSKTIGMVSQTVNQYGFRDGFLSVDTTLRLSLTRVEGF